MSQMRDRAFQERAWLVESKHAKSGQVFYLAERPGQGTFWTQDRDDAYRFPTKHMALGAIGSGIYAEDPEVEIKPAFHTWSVVRSLAR